MPSGCPRQVDFPTGQVSFFSHLPNEQGIKRVICTLNKKSKLRLVQGKHNLKATRLKGKRDFMFFLAL